MPAKKKPQKRHAQKEDGLKIGNTLVFSYLTLRKVVGILGIAFPFVVSLGGLILFHTVFQSSISAYYHTHMRDVFVGILWAIGSFLLSYRGYERADDIAGTLACVFALGVALFPTTADGSITSLIGALHQVFAALFFGTLIYFSYFLFTKTDPKKQPTERKLLRNRVYKICAYVMAMCVLLVAIYYFLPSEVASIVKVYKPVLWLEALAIVAFGLSWLTKGEAILADED